ncbi:MAG: MoaD/ThiS family protein [Pseudomonadota bacterium]
MRINVLYFAQCREARGKSEETMDAPAGSSAGDLLRRILSEVPSLAGLKAQIAVAVNQKISGLDAKLKDGDEVALLLPPSGG